MATSVTWIIATIVAGLGFIFNIEGILQLLFETQFQNHCGVISSYMGSNSLRVNSVSEK